VHYKELMRFNTFDFGQKVLTIARRLSTVDFQLERKPPGDVDTVRGVGDYVIVVRNSDEVMSYMTIDRLTDVIRAAMLYAVCDELEATEPHHPALRGMWKLWPENRQQVYANARRLEAELQVGPFRDRKACREV